MSETKLTADYCEFRAECHAKEDAGDPEQPHAKLYAESFRLAARAIRAREWLEAETARCATNSCSHRKVDDMSWECGTVTIEDAIDILDGDAT